MGNHYGNWFDAKSPEAELYEQLINEAIGFFGIEAFYMVRSSLTNFDSLMGDDPAKMFNQAYPVTMYIQSAERFDGAEYFSKFGFEARLDAQFLVPTRLFNYRMPAGFGRPREGDILWLPNFKAFFEIHKADAEHFFYTFGKEDIYGYSLRCRKWNYDQATVNTGIVTIDTEVNTIVLAYNFVLNVANANAGAPGGSYIIGEKVTGNQTGSNATIISWNKPTLSLNVKSIQGTFANGELLIGANSNARFTINTQEMLDSVNDPMSDNDDLADEAATVLTFSPNNPFGEPVA